ncbi:TelA-like protein SA1238 [uncultured Clostridium sp.]|nr:TelA-like protein SA1238 [uncultured Clostridium sp.]
MQAERAVTDMTNDLLKKNAEALKMGTIETAKESQRGVVDIEKRAAAEQELNRIEDELKAKMMEIRS